MKLVHCVAEELIFPGGIPDGAHPFSYEVAWGADMGGARVTNGAIGPDGTFRFVPSVRGPGRGGGGVDRIFGPAGMLGGAPGGGGGTAAGIASMLFGDLGPPGAGGTRGGPLGDGGMNRLTMRFGLPMGDDEGEPAQRFVQLRGVDPRGQERPITASLLSRMLGMAGPGGEESNLLEVQLSTPLLEHKNVYFLFSSTLFHAFGGLSVT